MGPQTLPPGYALTCIDGEWYPLESNLSHPLGTVIAFGLHDDTGEDMHFSRRQDAVSACQSHYDQQQAYERENWEHLAKYSRVYPDRCAHYHDEIIACTGVAPFIMHYPTVEVHVLGFRCNTCGYHPSFTTEGLTEEEALAKAAEQAYAARCTCAELLGTASRPSPVLVSPGL